MMVLILGVHMCSLLPYLAIVFARYFEAADFENSLDRQAVSNAKKVRYNPNCE
jgi:hypothetical protein